MLLHCPSKHQRMSSLALRPSHCDGRPQSVRIDHTDPIRLTFKWPQRDSNPCLVVVAFSPNFSVQFTSLAVVEMGLD
jgi:hypothetical protein